MYIDCIDKKRKNTPISYCSNKSMCLTGYAKNIPSTMVIF